VGNISRFFCACSARLRFQERQFASVAAHSCSGFTITRVVANIMQIGGDSDATGSDEKLNKDTSIGWNQHNEHRHEESY